MDEVQLPPSSYPLYTPLTVPIVKHLILRMMHAKRATSLNEARDLLLVKVREKRNIAYFYMNPFVHNPASRARKGDVTHYSTAWLLQTLTLHTPGQMPMLQDTLTKWSKRGLFHYRERGIPDYDTVAALLIARLTEESGTFYRPISRIRSVLGGVGVRMDRTNQSSLVKFLLPKLSRLRRYFGRIG